MFGLYEGFMRILSQVLDNLKSILHIERLLLRNTLFLGGTHFGVLGFLLRSLCHLLRVFDLHIFDVIQDQQFTVFFILVIGYWTDSFKGSLIRRNITIVRQGWNTMEWKILILRLIYHVCMLRQRIAALDQWFQQLYLPGTKLIFFFHAFQVNLTINKIQKMKF